jgi:hypothetical protein
MAEVSAGLPSALRLTPWPQAPKGASRAIHPIKIRASSFIRRKEIRGRILVIAKGASSHTPLR